MSEKNERYYRQIQKELGVYVPPPQFDKKFLGKLREFKDKEEAKFENKHLKAYLKGLEKFTFGFEYHTDKRGHVTALPKWHDVKFELIDLTVKA